MEVNKEKEKVTGKDHIDTINKMTLLKSIDVSYVMLCLSIWLPQQTLTGSCNSSQKQKDVCSP